MDRKRKRAIQKAVRGVLENCGEMAVPRDPKAICAKVGITLLPYHRAMPELNDVLPSPNPAKNKPAFTVDRNGVHVIMYDNSWPSPFPLAHEIGHWTLRHTQDTQANEDEANYFAALLIGGDTDVKVYPRVLKGVCAVLTTALLAVSFVSVNDVKDATVPPATSSAQHYNAQTATQSIKTQDAQQEPDNTEPPQTVTTHKGVVIGQEDTVYITPTGKRYHYLATCAGGNAKAVTLAEAQSNGLTPCQTCIRPKD